MKCFGSTQCRSLPYNRCSPRPRAPSTGKIVSAEDAARLIGEGDTVATGGFVGIGFAEEVAIALEALFLSNDPDSRKHSASPATSR